MDLAPLRAFELTARLGSISAAAVELGYSQSAVSRQIQSLERELGAELLRRTARGVRPTARGRTLLPHAQDIMASWDSARADLTGAGAARTRLRIGTFPAGTATLVAPALGALERRHPELAIGVRQAPSSALESAVAAGELDGALIMDSGNPRRTLRATPLFVDEMIVIVPPDHPDAPRQRDCRFPHPGTARDLAHFADQTWVEERGRPERLLVATAARAGFAPVGFRWAPDLSAKIAFVAAGLGVAMVPGLLDALARRRVGVVRLTDAPRRGVSWAERAEAPPGLEHVSAALATMASGLVGAPSANST